MSKPKFKISASAENNQALIRIDGYISDWNNYAEAFKMQLDAIKALGITDATVYINSGGGSVFQANEIANEIMRFTGTITAKLGAMCASAATYIACKCSTTTAVKNVAYMIHKPSMCTAGNADEIEAELKLLRNLQADYADTYSKKTGLSVDKIQEMWAQDYWMNAAEAKALGFIDEIEGEAEVTEEDIEGIQACGYKNMPAITATTSENQKNHIMKQQLIVALAAVFPDLGATSSESQVMASIETLKAKASRTDAAETKFKELKESVQKEKVDAKIAAAKADKRINDAQEDFWRKQLNDNFDDASVAIDAISPVIKITDAINKGVSGENRANWTYADYQEKDPEALRSLAENDEATFKRLFDAHYKKK